MSVKIEKPSPEFLKSKCVESWPIWTKEVSRFDWFYDSMEECLFLEGEVQVTTKDGKVYKFGKGDFVTFEKGLACTWDIKRPVRKHYNFN